MRCEHCQQEHSGELRFCPNTGKLIAPERYLPEGMLLDDKYQIGPLLGAGGMSAVFEATHVLLQKKLAIKLLLPEFSGNEEMMARLVREARAASATGHRNVALVTDMGRTREGTVYIVMEHLGSRSLENLIEEEAPISVERTAKIMCEVLAGLEAVHRKGIVHRDLKPNNIMLTMDDAGEEVVKILDFGISKVAHEESGLELTTIGKVMGTPTYMAPEQARGSNEVDQRTDLYACGAIMYTMLTGAPPVNADNYNALIVRILEGNIPPPSTKIMAIPSVIDRIVSHAMELQPQNRYQDALSFRRALEGLISNPSNQAAIPRHSLATEDQQDIAIIRNSAPPNDEFNFQKPLELTPLGASLADKKKVSPQKRAYSADPFAPPQEEEMPIELSVHPKSLKPIPRPQQMLELDDTRPVRHAERPQPGTLYNGSNGSAFQWVKAPYIWIPLVAIVGLLLWQYRGEIINFSNETVKKESVELIVDTQPANADVYIDGVLTTARPILLPRSENIFSVRVQAQGYFSETVEIKPNQTQFLRVKLRSRRRP